MILMAESFYPLAGFSKITSSALMKSLFSPSDVTQAGKSGQFCPLLVSRGIKACGLIKWFFKFVIFMRS